MRKLEIQSRVIINIGSSLDDKEVQKISNEELVLKTEIALNGMSTPLQIDKDHIVLLRFHFHGNKITQLHP